MCVHFVVSAASNSTADQALIRRPRTEDDDKHATATEGEGMVTACRSRSLSWFQNEYILSSSRCLVLPHCLLVKNFRFGVSCVFEGQTVAPRSFKNRDGCNGAINLNFPGCNDVRPIDHDGDGFLCGVHSVSALELRAEQRTLLG
jgi:hypothetical protein